MEEGQLGLTFINLNYCTLSFNALTKESVIKLPKAKDTLVFLDIFRTQHLSARFFYWIFHHYKIVSHLFSNETNVNVIRWKCRDML